MITTGGDDEDVFNRPMLTDNRRLSNVALNIADAFLDGTSDLSLDTNAPVRQILFSLLLAALWTLVLTLLPVVLDLPPDNYYAHHPVWFTGNDVCRLLEPIVGLLLNAWVLLQALRCHQTYRESVRDWLLLFCLGAGLYGLGAGLHSACAFISNAVESLEDTNNDLGDLYYYVHTLWQHIIAHYIYAAGYAIMNFSFLLSYHDIRASMLGLPTSARALLLTSASVYALLVAGVAIQFPMGLVVGLIYCALQGGGIAVYLYLQQRNGFDKNVFTLGQRPVLHHYLMASVFATLIMLAWIAAVGGIKQRTQVFS